MAGQAGRWKGLILLSIIIPVGLLTAVRLSGIGGPVSLETTRLDTVYWTFDRPTTSFFHIYRELNSTVEGKELNSTLDDGGLMTFSTIPYEYVTGTSISPAELLFTLAFDFSPISIGFRLEDVLVTLQASSGNSVLSLMSGGGDCKLTNLSIADDSLVGDAAYVHLTANSSSGEALIGSCFWEFYTPPTNEQLEIHFQVTYNNGTAYKRTSQPFIITLVAGQRHYLTIESSIEFLTSSEAVTGVSVWVDGQLYSTPVFGLSVPEGVHNITAPFSISVNGTLYRFIVWSNAGLDNSRVWNATSDLSISANYELNYVPGDASFSGAQSVVRGVQYTYTVIARDIDGSLIRYHLNVTSPVLAYQNSTGWVGSGTAVDWNLTWGPEDASGAYTLQAWAEDQCEALSNVASLSVILNVTSSNAASNGGTSVAASEIHVYNRGAPETVATLQPVLPHWRLLGGEKG